MDWLRRKRIKQIITYGWKDSAPIAAESGKKRIAVFFDIIRCFRKYYVFSYQYNKNKLWNCTQHEFDILASKIGKENQHHDKWVIERYRNHIFLSKWTRKKWEKTSKGSLKRKEAYTEFFRTGKDLQVQYNVEIRREHFLFGTISIGDNVLLAKNVFIDYSGEVVIKDNVQLANGVIIETHHHAFHSNPKESRSIIMPSSLVIEEGAVVGSRAIILSSCHYIGKNARVGAGAVVTKDVPDYTVVVGVPAKVVKVLPHED